MTAFTMIPMLIASALAGPEAEVNVSSPWTATELDAGLWAFSHPQHQGTLTLQTQERMGLNLNFQNRTLHTQTREGTFPLITIPFQSDDAQSIRIENQGIDLVIRIEGPSLREWTQNDTAPEDQSVLSWIRVRIRGERIRFVMTGAHRWTLPASSDGPHPKPAPSGGLSFNHGFGHWHYTSTAKGLIGAKQRDLWVMDWAPSIHLKDPYPTTTIEWSPSLDTPRP